MELLRPRTALDTYRYLRIAMPILVLMLAASLTYQIFSPEPDCWLGSISAYYYTSARAVFVACLCAIGTCLIIYRGNARQKPDGTEDNFEDFFLDVSGFLAFVVALVPTPLDKLSITPGDMVGSRPEPVCKRSNVPTDTQLTDALNNNIVALLVAASAVVVFVWVLHFLHDTPGHRSVVRALTATAGTVFLAAVVAVLWVLFLLAPAFVQDHAHIAAAVTMFAGIVVVVVLNSRHAAGSFKTWYRAIAAAMVGVTLVLGAIAFAEVWDHAVFWLEASLIGLFALFWGVQTKELWNSEQRGGPAAG